MIKKKLWLIFLVFNSSHLWAQFAPQAPLPGNDAIAVNDSRIVSWATGCTATRGWKNIKDTTLGKTTSGSDSSVLGIADLQTLSLGDGGDAIVTFPYPIKEGPGADFAVFENGFVNPQNANEAYLELAFVAVSSDGIHYVSFPATSLTQDTAQIDNFTYMDARLINNLAGKYGSGYGTPFDLSELADSPNLDMQNIRYVRITDVVGSIDTQYARYDKNGRMINEPFPSPYPTGGFDLNAIAVLHQQKTSIQDIHKAHFCSIWPVPATDFVHIKSEVNRKIDFEIYNFSGQKMMQGEFIGQSIINLATLPAGLYFVRCHSGKNNVEMLKFNKN